MVRCTIDCEAEASSEDYSRVLFSTNANFPALPREGDGLQFRSRDPGFHDVIIVYVHTVSWIIDHPSDEIRVVIGCSMADGHQMTEDRVRLAQHLGFLIDCV